MEKTVFREVLPTYTVSLASVDREFVSQDTTSQAVLCNAGQIYLCWEQEVEGELLSEDGGMICL